jgi:hypothetical protein
MMGELQNGDAGSIESSNHSTVAIVADGYVRGPFVASEDREFGMFPMVRTVGTGSLPSITFQPLTGTSFDFGAA